MTLRLKYGLTEVIRMSVELDPSVSSIVRSALVEGDWLTLSSAVAGAGQPAYVGFSSSIAAPANAVELLAVPVTTAPANSGDTAHYGSKLSYPIIQNPQSPENSVPGVGLTVACDRGYIGYTDRFQPSLGTSAYTNVPLCAHAFTVSGVTRYGLLPAAAYELAAGVHVAWGITVLNGELIFRYLP